MRYRGLAPTLSWVGLALQYRLDQPCFPTYYKYGNRTKYTHRCWANRTSKGLRLDSNWMGDCLGIDNALDTVLVIKLIDYCTTLYKQILLPNRNNRHLLARAATASNTHLLKKVNQALMLGCLDSYSM